MLVADVIRALPELRREAEAAMVTACTITRSGGAQVFDPNTGTYTDPAPVEVYAGKCKVQQKTSVSTDEVGGTVVTVLGIEVQVPVSVTGVDGGDTVTITGAVSGYEHLHDSALDGREYRVTDDPAKTFATARRLRCEEVR